MKLMVLLFLFGIWFSQLSLIGTLDRQPELDSIACIQKN
ncbi:MAG: hypothetical protein QG632_817 [Candidatus Dependentiae bacterium]|nr:hypothetical protein [Candidatus Dependentiae bacterium]